MNKISCYIDASNISLSGGFAMDYDVLLSYIMREGGTASRIHSYIAYDESRAQEDREYRQNQSKYFSIIRDFGVKIIKVPVKRYEDENGEHFRRSNADVRMAVDILSVPVADTTYILTGDGDFVPLVGELQRRGSRVVVIAFENVSGRLKDTADLFVNGFLIPNLIPIEGEGMADWGRQGRKGRGICYEIQHRHTFGFLRMMDANFDTEPVFFHFSELPEGNMPCHGSIYEFTLGRNDKGTLAKDVKLVC